MQEITQAVILAGGQGTRLRPITYEIPKPMVKIKGRPFLGYLIDLLKENGITEIVLLLGYLPEKITEFFGDGAGSGVHIRYSIGAVEDETGTRIRNAAPLLADRFLLLYCDNYWPLKLSRLAEFHAQKNALATMTVYTNKDGFTRSNVRVGEDGYVVSYDSTRSGENLNGVDIGFFIMEKRILELASATNFSLGKELLPLLVSRRELAGYMTDHRYWSISTPERLPDMQNFLRPQKVLFLDRDGVVNEKPPRAEYVRSWGEFKFLPGAVEALSLLTRHGYEIYLVTNQAGIGRGLMSEENLRGIHEQLIKKLAERGAKLNGIYYCPHTWDAGCECRKPRAGMFFQVSREHAIDLTKAWFVGDDERDLEAGEAAGCRTVLVTLQKSLLDIVRNEILA